MVGVGEQREAELELAVELGDGVDLVGGDADDPGAGGLAYWTLRLRGRFEWGPVVVWAALFFAFVGYVAVA